MGREKDLRDLRGAQLGGIFEDTTNNKRFYRVSTKSDEKRQKKNTFDFVKTTLTTTAKKIEMPETDGDYYLVHRSSGNSIYIGKDSNVTASNGFPVIENEIWPLKLKSGNNNNLYGVVSAGTIDVYIIGFINE